MASTGVPASSCRCAPTVSFEFNRHTVMSQIHPCPLCQFRFLNKNRIQSDCWSHVLCDENENGEKIAKSAMSAVKCWSTARLKDLLYTVGEAAHSKGPCWQLSCALCVQIYVFVCVCACMPVCCRQRGSCTEMRGEVESVSGWTWNRYRWQEEACRGKWQHPLPPLSASGHKTAGRWGDGAMVWLTGQGSDEETHSYTYTETGSVVQPSSYWGGGRDENNKTTEVIHPKTTEWLVCVICVSVCEVRENRRYVLERYSSYIYIYVYIYMYIYSMYIYIYIHTVYSYTVYLYMTTLDYSC